LEQAVSSVRRKPHRSNGSAAGGLFAALDLGTNNCRLLIATPSDDGFRVVGAFSRTTRLGEGLVASGVLSEEAICRTLAALKQCALRLVHHNASRVRSVATEACRRAGNCAAFLDRVHSETGLAIEIITAEEEARLALTGCAPLLDRQIPYALVFDIGGGSTELVLAKVSADTGEEQVEAFASLPLGVVTLTEQCRLATAHPAGYAATVNEVAALMRPFARHCAVGRLVGEGRMQLVGTSGTVTTLAGVHLDLTRYDRALVDGLIMDFAAIRRVSRRLVRTGVADRARHPCIGDRAELVIAGCAILEAICRFWPVGRLKVADRGVREGMLLSMMRAERLAAT
jgi:exopolyphosphatase/guanosine-5'-triphosphate,3'-diphosphate pyrophosphatase